MQVLLCTLFAIFSLVLSQTPTLPRLPPAFSVDIEANLLDSNKTLNIREYYDYNARFQRIDVLTVETYTYTITDYNKQTTYTIVDELTCAVAPVQTDTFATARSTEDILIFGDKYNETYVGVSVVRGVPCDSWISYISFTTNGTTYPNGTVVGAGVYHNFSIQYFFTVESWSFRAANVTRKPMRAYLSGSRTSPNGDVTYINHNYEFVNFVPRAPSRTVFDLPSVCVGVPQQIYTLITTTSGAGLAAGMFFLGLFIGAGITGLSIWVYCRRRQLARDRFAKSSLAMQENQ